jgi:hypothetical protein
MNIRLYFGAVLIIGTLFCAMGEFTPEFRLKDIPNGLTMMDVIQSLTRSPRYLAWSDHKKLKMLNSLIMMLKEAAKNPDQ